ncbi:MAG: hypothetical protein M3421_14900 [Bacteroidota bacterium]|nr:hypothetical protein [Bacteroidota bacterium]
MTRLKYILIFLICNFFEANSQNIEHIFLDEPRFLTYNNELPKNLISSRTAVFITCPYGNPSKEQKNWKEIAFEAHKGLKKSGIDAVAYYHFKDVLSGIDASRAFSEDLKKREIKNIIIIANDPQGSSTKFSLIITLFSDDHKFIAHNQPAWKSEDQELSKILDNLYRQVNSGGLEKANYLIIDQPEFFEDTKINKGKRFEYYLSDLKLDKLAVPKFEITEGTAQKSEGPLNNQVEEKLNRLKVSIEDDNSRLEGIMNAYPFEYEIVDGSRTEDQLRKAGFQYLLLRLNTSDQTIKDLLNYSVDKNASQEVLKYKKGGRSKPVYKYYIRHIYTGDIYLGNEWDAAETWHEALENHIFNMRKELKVN